MKTYNIQLTEDQIKVLKNAIYDDKQGMCDYVRYEVTDHICWKHSNPKQNVDFYTFVIFFKDSMSNEAESGFVTYFGQIIQNNLKLFQNFTNSKCLQDFIIDYFYF